MKHVILSFMAFICHDIYVQIKQKGTRQSTIFHDIQALRHVTALTYFYILILFCFVIRRSTIYSDRFSYSSNLLYK